MAMLGKTSEFVNGLRVTDAETRDIAIMVLAGKMNTDLVTAIGAQGQAAMGMCGGDGHAFRAARKFMQVAISALWARSAPAIPNGSMRSGVCDAVPVISSLAPGSDGQYYNINADQDGGGVRGGLRSRRIDFPHLCFRSERTPTENVIRWLEVNQISSLIQQAVIGGGMLPKLEACQQALRKGVRRVRILPATEAECIPDFYMQKIEYGTEVMVAVA